MLTIPPRGLANAPWSLLTIFFFRCGAPVFRLTSARSTANDADPAHLARPSRHWRIMRQAAIDMRNTRGGAASGNNEFIPVHKRKFVMRRHDVFKHLQA